MSTKFTPGPWLVRTSHFDSSGHGTPAISHGDTSAFMCWLNLSGAYNGYAGLDRAKADANLIAAAPQLYDALENALSWLSSYPGEGAIGAYNLARNALAAADGEA